MIVNAATMEPDAKDIILHLGKFVVSVNLDDTKPPCIVFLLDDGDFVEDRSFGPAQWERHGPIINSTGDGVKNCHTVYEMKIATQSYIRQIATNFARERNERWDVNARRFLVVRASF